MQSDLVDIDAIDTVKQGSLSSGALLLLLHNHSHDAAADGISESQQGHGDG